MAENADYIFWSGDNTAHDDPFVSQAEVNTEIESVVDLVARKLKGLDLSVVLGNHDAFPNTQWDFKTEGPSVAGRKDMKQFVPESEWDRWNKHGYYAKDLTSLKTRVLSLNTQSCDFHNVMLW